MTNQQQSYKAAADVTRYLNRVVAEIRDVTKWPLYLVNIEYPEDDLVLHLENRYPCRCAYNCNTDYHTVRIVAEDFELKDHTELGQLIIEYIKKGETRDE